MLPEFSFRACLPLALAALCCSCTTPEERADAAFGELCAVAEQLRAELAGISDEASAERALPILAEQADELRDILARLDKLAEDPELTREVRRRLGERYHAPLKTVVDAIVLQAHRLALREMYHSEGLTRLARMEYAHYSPRKVHPWVRAVLAGREYRPKLPRKKL